MWPLCPDCQTHHINSCEDAADWREIRALFSRYLDAAMFAPATPMAEVPPALRGPRWAW